MNRQALVFGLVGLICLVGAVVCAARAVSVKADEDAFAAAKPCPTAAAWNADCLQDVEGSVLAVDFRAGRPTIYTLHASTTAGPLSANFHGPNLLVQQALPGDAVVLTTWRGTVEAVSGYGLREVTSDVPSAGMRGWLAGSSFLAGTAMLCLPCLLLVTRSNTKPKTVRPGRPVRRFLTGMWFGTGTALVINTFVLGFGVSPGVDLVVVAGLLAGVAVLCARMTVKLGRPPYTALRKARLARQAAENRGNRPVVRQKRQVKRISTAQPRRNGIAEAAYVVLTVGVCVAAIYAYAECVPGRAHDHAPICSQGVIASSCRAETTLQVRGTRPFGADLDIVFTGPDGSAIVTRFDRSATLEEAAQEAAQAHTGLPVELWRGGVWEAHAAGKGYLPPGEPRYEIAAIALLAAASSTFLAVSRIRLRRRPQPENAPRVPWYEDGGQTLLLAAGLAFLWEGHPWAVAYLAADAGWLIWSFASASRASRISDD